MLHYLRRGLILKLSSLNVQWFICFRRIDECTEQNKKLDSKLKKKEEALQKAEQDLDEVENR